MWILRVLLSDTNLEIKIPGANTKPFQSNIGSPQGDVLSGFLFTIYFKHYWHSSIPDASWQRTDVDKLQTWVINWFLIYKIAN